MSWFTSTPLSFAGGPDFFCRDSGLICKGLQSLGLSCKCIMPFPAHPSDLPKDLIRVAAENLTNPNWWNSIGAEKVVLYSWGHFRYKGIAEAIRDSGGKAFVNLDGSGICSPKVTPGPYFSAVMGRQIRLHGSFLGLLSGVLRSVAYRFYIPFVQEPGRIAHLQAATAIGCISPPALVLWRSWARTYAPELVERMHLVPNPVTDDLKYDSTVPKQDIVVAVGRWDDEEPKRPALLASVVGEVAKRRSSTEFHIYGKPGNYLPKWYKTLQKNLQNRIHLHG